MAKRHGLQLTKRRAAQLKRYANEPPCFRFPSRKWIESNGKEPGFWKPVKPRNSPVPGFRFKS